MKREYCGIVGIYSKKKEYLSEVLYLSLFSLQHRGQEAVGVVVFNGIGVTFHKDFGLVKEVLNKEVLQRLKGYVGIGHTRYSTVGDSRNFSNIQPLLVSYEKGFAALAHNGTLTNYREVRSELEKRGYVFHSTTDSEILLYLFVSESESDIPERVRNIYRRVKGAYSTIVLVNDVLVFFKDPWGFRPLVYGENKDYIMVASETAALKQAGIVEFKELEPGEVGIISNGKLEILKVFETEKKEQCVFELIYFSRPDSNSFGFNVYNFRKECGRELARREDREIDIVVPVPDSGVPASVGYSEKSGKPLEFGLMRSHFSGRSFIEPRDRETKVKMKLIPIREVIEGKRIALIDDSLVRGTTSKEIVKLLKQNGAKEVHLRFASPPIVAPCFFGIDIPTKEELLASSFNLQELAEYLGADSIKYLPISSLKGILGEKSSEFCFACFTGSYNPACVSTEILEIFSNYHPKILEEVG
ncbi:MAG: amidophosphoribosyltransferase [Candidatus Hydrothermia bacterium]